MSRRGLVTAILAVVAASVIAGVVVIVVTRDSPRFAELTPEQAQERADVDIAQARTTPDSGVYRHRFQRLGVRRSVAPSGKDAWLVTYLDQTVSVRICVWVTGGYGGSNTLRACGRVPEDKPLTNPQP
jgi:hypothetical protein